MLLGTHTPKLDDKGRLILPAKFREELDGGVVITRGQEKCLVIFSSTEFDAVLKSASAAPLTNKDARDYARVLMSGANAETPDKQGRVTLPQHLRAYASLEKDLVVIGVGNRAEIWNSAAWNEYLAAQEEKFSNLDEEVTPGVL